MSENEATQTPATSSQLPPSTEFASLSTGTAAEPGAESKDPDSTANASPVEEQEDVEASLTLPDQTPILPTRKGSTEGDTSMARWRTRGLRFRGTAKVRTEQTVAWASKDSTKKAAVAVGGLLAAAVIKAIQEQRTGKPAPALQPRSKAPTADPKPSPTASNVGFYPTPQRQLRLDGTDRFVEWPHHEIAGLIIGVTPTSGLSANKILVRWEPYIPNAIIVEESTLSGQWRRPFDHRPAVPLELRLIEPGIVGFRFLDPGDLRTGPVQHRPQQQVAPLSAEAMSRLMVERHNQAMAVIRNIRP